MDKRYLPFRLLTISVFIILLLPVLMQDGMFMDGLQYACVSKNLAHHLGTFWFPHLSDTWMKNNSPNFLEHPPLVYGIESIFFKIFGDSIYVERFYSLLTALISASLIIIQWKFIAAENPEIKKASWLAVLFWILIPVCYWSYQNNMQENTMGIFTLISVYFSLRGIKEGKILWIFISGVSIFLATFCKGIPGFFPSTVIMLYWIINKNISFLKAVLLSAVLVITPLLIYFLLLLDHEAKESLTFYFYERLLHRLNEPDTTNRFFILINLFQQLLPLALLCSALILIFRKLSVSINYNKSHKNNIALFFLTGLSGSLPLMLTMVQKGFYVVPALAYFAIAFALLIAPGMTELIKRINITSKSFKIFFIISLMMLAVSIFYSTIHFKKASRDKEMLEDVHKIGAVVPKNSIIKINGDLFDQWKLQFYLLRNFNISVDASGKLYDYYLIKKSGDVSLPENYKKIELPMKGYDLYKQKKDNTASVYYFHS